MKIKISKIQTSDTFSKIFKIKEPLLNALIRNMAKNGYDKNHPIILWNKGKNTSLLFMRYEELPRDCFIDSNFICVYFLRIFTLYIKYSYSVFCKQILYS